MKRIPFWLPFAVAAIFTIAFSFERQFGLDSDWSIPFWFLAGPGLLVGAIFAKLALDKVCGEAIGLGLGLFVGMLGFNLAIRAWWNRSRWNVSLKFTTYLAVAVGGGYLCYILMISMVTHFQGTFWKAIGVGGL